MNEGQKKWRFDGCKLMWHMDRVRKHYDEGERIAPLHIDMAITKKCNARCSYCYGIFQEMDGSTMSSGAVWDVMSTASKIGVKSITLTGDGENTLNPALWEGLVEGKRTGLDIGLATNGINLDEEKIKVILSTCTWLRFNLSAVDKESYKSLMGVDQWERVQANILTVMRLKKEMNSTCTVGLQMVLIPEALEQVIPEARFATIHGLDYFVIKQFSDPGCEEMSQFNLSWYDNQKVKDLLYTAECMSTSKTKIVPKWGAIEMKGRRHYDHCLDVPLLFQVSGNGKCYPCGYLFSDDRYCYGDLEKQTLQEILESEHYWERINYMKTKFNVHKDCKGCCRHDFTNRFIHNYLDKPDHLNFI